MTYKVSNVKPLYSHSLTHAVCIALGLQSTYQPVSAHVGETCHHYVMSLCMLLSLQQDLQTYGDNCYVL